jgi:hypothetical protein
MSVSVIVPARNEPYLTRTIADVFEKATGEIEVIAVCDGYDPPLPIDSRLVVIRHERAQGMRPSINEAAERATGDYLLKLDAHCLLAPGFDEALAADCDDDWVVTPARQGLDPVQWFPIGDLIEAHYLTCPVNPNPKHAALRARHWRSRAETRRDVRLDDDMSFQGSCWFMSQKHWRRLGGLSCEGYGPFVQEPQEIGLKTWLGGGAVKINKRTWYAHWKKTEGQGYVLSPRQSREGLAYSTDYWMNNRWSSRVRDLSWLIDKFAPVPGWPA